MPDFLQVPKGLVLPLVLPLGPDGSINWKMLERMLIEYIRRGVKAFFLASTTGRVHELNAQERGHLFIFVQGVCARNGGATLMVGCMDTCLDQMLRHFHAVVSRGCRMVVASPPWYARLSQYELANVNQSGVLDVFAKEAANKGASVVWYDHPHAGWMSTDMIAQLAEHPNSAGIKDSSREDRALILSPLIPYFAGHEVMARAALLGGASGIVSSLAHINPGLFQQLVKMIAVPDVVGHGFGAMTIQNVIGAGHQSFLDVSEPYGGAFSALMRYLEACIGLKLTHPWEGVVTVPSSSRELWRAPDLLPGVEPVWFGGE
jgi:4-hydroxy-tetrahydrodipicolinate synthase